jgi:hypothetical protein
MGRALKILAYAVILFLTYLVITAGLKSCSNKKDTTSVEMNDSAESNEYSDDDYFEDGAEEPSSQEDDFFGSTEAQEDINYDEIDKALDEKKTPKPQADADYTETTTQSTTPIRSNYSSGSTSGDYLVIAGSYIINTNAENMILKLKKMGYDKAEIIIFDQSQYHTVVASRSNNYDQALSVSGTLKSKGIDSYVHRKK